nr:reverse transcriptase domain-containing protein [Tanacetum cinerariifolium]
MVTKLRNEITNFRQRLDESLFEAWESTVGQTQNVYVVGAYQGGNSYQPQGNRNLLSYRSDNYLGPPGFNQNQNRNNQNPNFQNQNRNHRITQGNNQGRNQFFQGASHGPNLSPAYQAPAYQAPGYQAPVHQPSIPQPQVMTTVEFTNYMKMNTASSLGSRTLSSNTVTNLNEDLKGITTRSGTAYQGPTIPTTSSSLPKVVERETDVTKDIIPPTNNESTKDVQSPVVQIETPMPNSKPVIAPIIEQVAAPVIAPKPYQKPRSFLKTEKALIDVFEGELTLRVHKEAITFNLDQTSRYSANYNDMTANQIDVIDMDCEVYSQEVLDFFDVITSGNSTPYYDPIVSTSSPTLTPFRDSDFLLEEVDAFLAFEDDATSPKVDHSYFDPKGDILLLEAFLNDDPSLPPHTQGNYLPQVRKELKICEAKNDKSSIDELPEVELKDLPPHLEYAFLEGNDKLPVIIAKDLTVEEKAALIKVLKSYKQAIAWKLSDIKGIDPKFYTHKILMEDDFEPVVQHQRRVNPKIHDVIKNEVLQRCEDTNLCLNWEKSQFMVKEGIVLGHKISKNGIEVDKAKVDVIARLPHPTTVKGAVLGRRKTKHFQSIHYASKTMTDAQAHCTTTEKELLAMVYAFEKFRPYLVLSKSIVYTDHSALKYLFNKQDANPRLLRRVLLLQEFDITVRDKKGAESLATDHLS